MKTNIITPAEVVGLAFSDGGYLAPDVIAEADIAVAVERWVEPVVGEGVLQAVADGKYSELKSDYLLPAIALYTRLLVQPRLNGATGQLGLTVGGGSARAASDALRREHLRAIKERARMALKRLSTYLDAHAGQIAEYDEKCNILKRCSCDGGFVQIL
ncbi:MAG: hypothetical protein J6U52_03975 [Alistipes sp.]|nr:hypothetical protein [Alistipes sp.]